ASYTGSSPEEAADRYSAITPANHISKTTPPTLAVSGATDHLVPQEPTADLIAKLHAEGIDARQIVVPYGEHVFDGAVGNVGSQIWRQATLKWFSEHGLAPVG
ncbi:MAG: prolyl oligopeptidase family serine peptidase, partial [Rothia sp. (in: high G+C Gram-positive bacteria)]|nr:prolyl oligopeptidase family serine peptidase [Rothia sp. (in: high G+C Gram-positive bacteria)]